MNKLNTNILVIDDEESVQRNIMLTLAPKKHDTSGLSGAANVLFGDGAGSDSHSDSHSDSRSDSCSTSSSESNVANKDVDSELDDEIQFNITTASNGQKALELVKQAKRDDRPFAVVFCDMRMPGWDGLKTVEEIRAVDPRMEVVFLTAFSDHSIKDISRSIGVNISYMSKPFSRPDLIQMATRLVVDWNKARELEVFLDIMTKMRGQQQDFEVILNFIIDELCVLMNTKSAAIAEASDNGLVYRAGNGDLAKQDVFDELNFSLASGGSPKNFVVDGVRVIPIVSFGVALVVASDKTLSPEKQYLLNAFMEHVSMALRNHKLQQALNEQKQLAEIGQAIGFVSHDIRGPIGQAELLVKMLRKGGRMPWPPEIMYEKILHALDQARQLADDILQFSKSEMTIVAEATSVQKLLALDSDYWQHLASTHDVQFEITNQPDLQLTLDGARFMRAVTNIIKNAIEATAGKPERKVTLSFAAEQKALTVSIEDTAGGVPADVLPNLFQPFASSGKAHGTGFGLAIADKVVKLHNGLIDVRPTDKGTRFDICIPDAVAG